MIPEEVVRSLETTVASSVRDWAAAQDLAWVYGIVIGWDDDSLNELSHKFQWGVEAIARLRELRNVYISTMCDLRENRYQILNTPADASSVSVTQSSQSAASG